MKNLKKLVQTFNEAKRNFYKIHSFIDDQAPVATVKFWRKAFLYIHINHYNTILLSTIQILTTLLSYRDDTIGKEIMATP